MDAVHKWSTTFALATIGAGLLALAFRAPPSYATGTPASFHECTTVMLSVPSVNYKRFVAGDIDVKAIAPIAGWTPIGAVRDNVMVFCR